MPRATLEAREIMWCRQRELLYLKLNPTTIVFLLYSVETVPSAGNVIFAKSDVFGLSSPTLSLLHATSREYVASHRRTCMADRVFFCLSLQIVKSTPFTVEGWGGSMIGIFWGGITVQGILPYYYEVPCATVAISPPDGVSS